MSRFDCHHHFYKRKMLIIITNKCAFYHQFFFLRLVVQKESIINCLLLKEYRKSFCKNSNSLFSFYWSLYLTLTAHDHNNEKKNIIIVKKNRWLRTIVIWSYWIIFNSQPKTYSKKERQLLLLFSLLMITFQWML